MDCVMCDGTTTATTRPKAVERDGKVAVIRDVPVEVCDSCGEVYLDGEVAKRLDELFRQMLTGNVDQVFGHYEAAAA
jgi:YgiT-type zinc finger domain-containing protein